MHVQKYYDVPCFLIVMFLQVQQMIIYLG